MSQLKVDWHRLFGICFALATVCLAAGCFAKPPLQDVLRFIVVGLLVGFIPWVMAIYFLRGFLRIQ